VGVCEAFEVTEVVCDSIDISARTKRPYYVEGLEEKVLPLRAASAEVSEE
jgi:hypothetical protein